MSLGVGEVFAGYTVVRQIGNDGMGEVYLAQHPRLPRQEALKVLRPEISSDDSFRQRFIREADSIAALEHPNIVTVHDRGENAGRLWIATQYVDGADAAQLLRDRYPAGMPADEAATIIAAIAEALDHAHDRGLLHRDVKPANILLTHADRDGSRRIYLADFGIARPLDDPTGLTSTNFALGTFAYAAPEQLMGKPVDGRADQYALAATAFHLLTGRQVFADTNQIAVIGRHLTEPAPRLSTVRPDLAPYDAAFARALAKNPADRFPRCQDFAQAITHAAVHSGTANPSTAPTQQAPVPAPTQGRELKAAPGLADTREPDPAANASSMPHELWIGISVALLVFVAAVAVWWQPWSSAQQTGATGTPALSRQSSVPRTDASLPSVGAASPPTTSPAAAEPPPMTSQADQYRYALPGCNFDPPQEKPAVLPFQTCADGSQRLEAMSWSSWDRAGAQGTGIFSFKVCEPSCAEGHRAQYGVNVSAFNPAPAPYNSGCPSDVMFYSEMVVTFLATPPTDIGVDSTYLGKPAIRFTTLPEESGNGFLGNLNCF